MSEPDRPSASYFAELALEHALAVQKIEHWQPSADQESSLRALAYGKVKISGLLASYIPQYRTINTTAYRKPLFSRFDPYYYPGKSVLRNNFSITNAEALTQLEALCSSARIITLIIRAMNQKIAASALEIPGIHATIFGDTYPWAGQLRTVGISKGDSYFAPKKALPELLEKVADPSLGNDQKLASTPTGTLISSEEIVYHLAQRYALYNYAHPFREGNGRAGMTWLELLANKQGWHIEFRHINSSQWHQASVLAMPKLRHGPVHPEPLCSLLQQQIVPLAQI